MDDDKTTNLSDCGRGTEDIEHIEPSDCAEKSKDSSLTANRLSEGNKPAHGDRKRILKSSSPATEPRNRRSNGLRIVGNPEGVEAVSTYSEGGNLPVHLGSHLGRYKVIHKLGHGRTSVVWLCRDLESGDKTKYYAVKVFHVNIPPKNPDHWIGTFYKTIEGVKLNVNLLLPLEYINIDGPNGTNNMIVYPLMGPKMSTLYHLRSSFQGERILRKMCYHIARALKVLHESNLCHGGR